jgi:hypothetical protein
MRLPTRLSAIHSQAYILCIILAISCQMHISDALCISLAASNSALRVVENFASIVAAPPTSKRWSGGLLRTSFFEDEDDEDEEVSNLEGLGGQVYTNGNGGYGRNLSSSLGLSTMGSAPKEQVWTALSRLEANSKLQKSRKYLLILGLLFLNVVKFQLQWSCWMTWLDKSNN